MRDLVGRRRAFALGLSVAAATPLAFAATPAAAQVPALPERRGRTYVLVHGSWLGGWFWAPVAERLRAQGHRVFTPTQTGMGERRHLFSRDITLDTFVEDLVNVIKAEELREVILVGHSFAGLLISGVTDRMPEAIRRLVYLDANLPQSDQSFFDALPPEVAAGRRRLAEERGGGIVVPPPAASALAAMGVGQGPVAEWMLRRMTPQPIGTYETPLRLANPLGNGRPCTYVALTSPAFAAQELSRRRARGLPGWDWAELAAGHAAPATVPDAVARLLAGFG